MMVIVIRRPRYKSKRELNKQHDFSRNKDHCAKCGMQLSVWEDTRVFCPGKPYAINTNRPLSRRAS
jgi:hypothetical protein